MLNFANQSIEYNLDSTLFSFDWNMEQICLHILSSSDVFVYKNK